MYTMAPNLFYTPVPPPNNPLNQQHTNPEYIKQGTRNAFASFDQENNQPQYMYNPLHTDSVAEERRLREEYQQQQQAIQAEQARRALQSQQFNRERANRQMLGPVPTFVPRPDTWSRYVEENSTQKAMTPVEALRREQLQHRQQEQLHQQQSPEVKKEVSPRTGIVAQFIDRIRDRFPGRPQLVQQFVAMMNSQTPTRDLDHEFAAMFRTAREIVADFHASTDALDRDRFGRFQQLQQQPPQAPQAQDPRHQHQPYQQLPPRPPFHPGGVVGYGYGDEDDRASYGRVISEDIQSQEVQHLLSLPEIDIAPEQRKKTPGGLSCTLMEHQKVGLTWLMQQEEDAHKNGGILADTMGLGKTIQALALILARPPRNSTQKTTLIIAPLALMYQWEQEIITKVKPSHKLKTYMYHGKNMKKRTSADLLKYDIVLTTYRTIASEYKNRDKKPPVILDPNALFYRVILDEAHNIKTRTAQCSIAAARIRATYRLCMTGTPFMNRIEEIYPLIHFLRIKPYDDWHHFHRHINKPISQRSNGSGPAMRQLQALFRSITLRRTKMSTIDGEPIVKLPPLTKYQTITKLNDDQRAFYDALETKQQLKVNQFLKPGMPMKKYTYILTLLLRLRQACCHPHLIRDFGIPEGVSLSPKDMLDLAGELDDEIVEKLKAQTEFECTMCQESTESPLILFPCGHPICGLCFAATLELKTSSNPDAQCPCQYNGCQSMIDTEQIICYCFFLEAHKLGQFKEESEQEDTDDESDGYESIPDDDADERGNLKGFVVSDDEDEKDDPGSTDTDSKPTPVKEEPGLLPEPGNDSFWAEVSAKKESVNAEDSDNDSLPSVSHLWRNRMELLDINSPKIAIKTKKRETTPDSTSDNKARIKKESLSRGKRKRDSNKSSPISKKKRKTATGEKREKKKSTFLSMAALKAKSATNPAAKAKYLKRLREDWVPSAKSDKTIELLHAIEEKSPGEKTLVFSLWTSFLDLLEIPMEDHGFKYLRYDGSMRPEDRAAAVKKFMEDPETRVMLVSLSAGNAGLNLMAASHVIMLEPFWNPFIEDQAIDRTHRIGQKKEVTVHHVLIEGTVEDRIRDLQSRKRELVNEALSEEGARGVSRLSVAELRGLFGLR